MHYKNIHTTKAGVIIQTFTHRSLTPCETTDSNLKAISITKVELWGLEFLICMEECIYKDVKEKDEKEKARRKREQFVI